MTAIILNAEQLEGLTGRVRPSAQRRILAHLRIPFRVRPDGTPVVFEADLHATPKERSRSPALRL